MSRNRYRGASAPKARVAAHKTYGRLQAFISAGNIGWGITCNIQGGLRLKRGVHPLPGAALLFRHQPVRLPGGPRALRRPGGTVGGVRLRTGAGHLLLRPRHDHRRAAPLLLGAGALRLCQVDARGRPGAGASCWRSPSGWASRQIRHGLFRRSACCWPAPSARMRGACSPGPPSGWRCSPARDADAEHPVERAQRLCHRRRDGRLCAPVAVLR